MKRKIKWLRNEQSTADAVGGEVDGIRRVESAVQLDPLEMSNWSFPFIESLSSAITK